MNAHTAFVLLKKTWEAWTDDHAPSMGAALAFYSAFSIAPLLVLIIAIVGVALGSDAAHSAVLDLLRNLVGGLAAEGIKNLLQANQSEASGGLAAVVGFVMLLVGATTVVVELEDDLDRIWKAPPRPGGGLLIIVRSRLVSLGMILGIGFLLLVSLTVSSVLAAIGKQWPSAAATAAEAVHFVISLIVISALFAMLYKWLPNVRIAWADVFIGAVATALLFDVGHYAIGFYLGRTAVASAYGAAGTVVVLLLWLYYTAQIFLFGAEFTCVYAHHRAGGMANRQRHSDPAHPATYGSARQ